MGCQRLRALSNPHARSPSRRRPLACPAATASVDLPVMGSRAAACLRKAASLMRSRRTRSRSSGLATGLVVLDNGENALSDLGGHRETPVKVERKTGWVEAYLRGHLVERQPKPVEFGPEIKVAAHCSFSMEQSERRVY